MKTKPKYCWLLNVSDSCGGEFGHIELILKRIHYGDKSWDDGTSDEMTSVRNMDNTLTLSCQAGGNSGAQGTYGFHCKVAAELAGGPRDGITWDEFSRILSRFRKAVSEQGEGHTFVEFVSRMLAASKVDVLAIDKGDKGTGEWGYTGRVFQFVRGHAAVLAAVGNVEVLTATKYARKASNE